uniref:ethanolamine kinase n=1 Tax=Piliocolobus tephrosceles TaxID=591936 RepID=A0A8C9GBP5_9PRIM
MMDENEHDESGKHKETINIEHITTRSDEFNCNPLKITLNLKSNDYSQITEHKNKQGVEPLTEDDFKGRSVDEIMKKYINNVFANKHVLYLYCKYVMLYYGKELINEKKIDCLFFEKINGGITNILVKVECKEEKKKYLIRLYGPKTNEIINREREQIISSILYDKNISKQIYVFFVNGRIEEYVEGYALSKEEIKSSFFQKEIAINLKKLHDIDLNDVLYKNLQHAQHLEEEEEDKDEEEENNYTSGCRYNNKNNHDKNKHDKNKHDKNKHDKNKHDKNKHDKNKHVSFLWSTIWKYYNVLNEERNKHTSFDSKLNILKLIDFDMLKDLIKHIEKLCNNKKSPIVLSHCDLLSSNIINTKNNTIYFIDFEYSCPMERAFDIANHFNEYAGFACEWSLLPNNKEEYYFIKNYLNTQDKTLINQLIDEIQPFYLASHITWGLWALLQAIHSPIDFDFTNYGITRLTASCLPIFRSKVLSFNKCE